MKKLQLLIPVTLDIDVPSYLASGYHKKNLHYCYNFRGIAFLCICIAFENVVFCVK